MSDHGVLVAGLPNSGKTTFLAALWHLIRSDERPRQLRYGGLQGIDASHLNAIEERWLAAEPMARTKSTQERAIRLNLVSADQSNLVVNLADFAGESFRRMWEHRRCPQPVLDAAVQTDALLFLVNADRIQYPRTVYENRRDVGERPAGAADLPYDPRKAPTATMIADVLYGLEREAFDRPIRKLILGLTAWDAVKAEGQTPEELLRERLPLVSQMLAARNGRMQIQVWGISAQGGAYDTAGSELRNIEVPADRIIMQHGSETQRDLTAPLAWLLG